MKQVLIEIFIIVSSIFVVNNYIGNVDKTLNADGVGYYDYLPSIFIHHDLIRKDYTINQNGSIYKRIINTDVYNNYNGCYVDKYPCGTALLELPFFSYTLLLIELDHTAMDGYQLPFQKSVYYAALFYLFLSIFFLRKLLLLYEISFPVIFFCQLCLVLGTSVTHYAFFDSGFSHVYSLFAITSFMYFSKKYFTHRIAYDFIIASGLLGLIFIIRQPNIIIVLFLPFLSGSKNTLFNTVAMLYREKRSVVISYLSFMRVPVIRLELKGILLLEGALIFFVVSSIQFVLWYLQSGDFFVYSYKGESFDFLNPQLINILFSYKKGLYIYTPLLFFGTISVLWFAAKRKYYLFLSWCAFFFILTYLLSSWWCWYYGCSYGLRAYIDFYPIFFIPFAVFLNDINKFIQVLIVAFSLLSIPLNIVQVYQYEVFILHWVGMDKGKYWKVFLNTDDTFKGLLWKNTYNMNDYITEKEIFVGDIEMEATTSKNAFCINSDETPNFENVRIIQVLMDDKYVADDKSEVTVKIDSLDRNYYWHKIPLIHFHEKELGELQTGLYNFDYNKIPNPQNKIIILELESSEKRKKFYNIRVRFLSRK
jgi:hypothetical protein